MQVGAMAAVMVLAGALLLPAARAAAQDDSALLRDGVFSRDRNVSVTERPKPEYEPLPIRAGAVLIAPAIIGGLAYDDNIYASDAKAAADGIVTLAPSVSLASDWPRHQITAFAQLSQALYLDHSGEDTTDYAGGLDGRLDVRRDLGLAGGVEFERDTEPRTSEASPAGSLHPVQYDLASGWVEGAKTAGRLRLTLRGSIQDYAYDNAEAPGGGEIYQHDQDRTENVGAGRLEYAYSPELSILTSFTANQRRYRDAAPGEASRTSSGYEATAGASFDLASLTRGEIFVGYLEQTYDNPAYRRVSGVALRGKVEYFPTPLTTITATASRGVQESGIPGVAGYIAETAAVQIDHELLRNLVLSAHLAQTDNRYQAYSRRDDLQTVWASATYLMNRALSFALKYDRLIRRSRGADAGQQYAVNRVMAAITCRF